MKKVVRWLDANFEPLIMTIFFVLMLGLVTLQVILRIFGAGFSWGEEVSRIFFVWMSFSAFGYLCRNVRHVGIGFIRNSMPISVQKIVLLVTDILFLAFTVIAFSAVVVLCFNTYKFNDMLIAIPVSRNVLNFAGVFGFLMMSIRNVQVIVYKLKHWNCTIDKFINYDGKFYTNKNTIFDKKEG